MVKLLSSFSRLLPQKILIAGDLLLDTYTMGKVRRISPEAPVAVIDVELEQTKLGGAGNVLLNFLSLGAEATLISRVGDDDAGKTIRNLISQEGVETSGIITHAGYKTPIKNRIIADAQQVVRVDHEKNIPLTAHEERQLIQKLPSLLEGVQALAISDYGKGLLSIPFLQALIQEAVKRGIYVIADPKGTDYYRYQGAHLVKPNLSEAYLAAHLPREAPLEKVADKLLTTYGMETLMITLGDKGIGIFQKGGINKIFPVVAREVKDVTGAGDTVLAMLTFALANQLNIHEAIELCNTAAGLAIEQLGCAKISLSQLARRLLSQNVINKIFDKEHLHALKSSLKGSLCHAITLDPSTPPSLEFISFLSQKKKETGRPILALLKHEPPETLLNFLASLQPIDFILVDCPAESIQGHIEVEHLHH